VCRADNIIPCIAVLSDLGIKLNDDVISASFFTMVYI